MSSTSSIFFLQEHLQVIYGSSSDFPNRGIYTKKDIA